MDDFLLVMLSIIGLLAIYWAMFGQWKHNRMMREAEEKARKRKETAAKDSREKAKEKTDSKRGSD